MQNLQKGAALYFVAHLLPPDLDAVFLKWKENLRQHYGCSVGLKSPAHITLVAPFWMPDEHNQHLLNDATTIAASTLPFEIELHNFSAFGKRTLFADVGPNQNLQNLYAATQDVCAASSFYTIKRDSRPFHPHVTLATRDIKPADFDEAWKSFSTRRFTTAWKAESLSILRHNKSHWDVVHTASFAQ